VANCIILSGGTWTPEYQPKIQRSLGPYRISSALEDSGFSTFVLDYIIHMSVDEIKNVLDKHLSEDTLWVGFSSTFFWANNSSSFNQTKTEKMYYTQVSVIEEIIQHIRDKSSAKIVYGGAKAPFLLSDKNIDYYVIGYADNSTVELTKHIATGSNLDMKPHAIDGKETYIIESNNFEEPKMDNIKTSWKNHNVLPKEGLPLELARGCIFKCKFCSYPLLGKSKGTYLRDPNEIRDEMIEMWELYGTDSYYITDDTFNDDNDKIEALHKVFTALPFKPKFSAYLRIDLINKFPHQADLLSEMGLIGTYLGLETFQPESAVSIGKGLKPHKVKDRLYWLNEKWKGRVNIGAGFILGLPYDTEQYFKELIDWCMENDNPLQHTSFYPLFLFPRPKGHNLAAYTSEFSLNPEIYGYKFNDKNNFMQWSLESQDLDYNRCQLISDEFSRIIYPRNKVAEFQMITYMNSGIPLQDLYDLSLHQIYQKYDTKKMNTEKINQYKQMIGAMR
jgi:hypothetical protein